MANPHFQNMILWAGNTDATEAKKNQPMFMPYPSDQTFYGYFNDFTTYNSGDWTITTTEAGGGSASEEIISGAGGQLRISNDDAASDSDFLQLKGESFRLSTSKKAYFSARFKCNDVDQNDFIMGLQITDTTPLDVSDGVYFISVDGSADLLLNVEKDNSVDATTVATMEDDTFITVTWFVDPDRDAVYYSINNATPVKVSNAKLPDDEDLTISFGIQNGEAAGNTLTIDYVNMIVER